jgi:gluconolactonase
LRGTLSKVIEGGKVEVIAHLGGGPNGAAIGPDGQCYVCNNGGFEWEINSTPLGMRPILQSKSYSGGKIQRVNIETGQFETLYEECNGIPLKGPNDIVFDKEGNFWFTDLGKQREREIDRGSIYWAKSDGSLIKEVIQPIMTPNGIGLSPDEKVLYVAETEGGKLFGFDISGEGEVQ